MSARASAELRAGHLYSGLLHFSVRVSTALDSARQSRALRQTARSGLYILIPAARRAEICEQRAGRAVHI